MKNYIAHLAKQLGDLTQVIQGMSRAYKMLFPPTNSTSASFLAQPVRGPAGHHVVTEPPNWNLFSLLSWISILEFLFTCQENRKKPKTFRISARNARIQDSSGLKGLN